MARYNLERMESGLDRREIAGVPDAILLENYQSEDAFIENLQKRYNENEIYTYIGHVLVSVNPYKDVGIYDDKHLEKYRKVNFYEVPPHVFAIAESAYRSMTAEDEDQCVLISGESGAGKTEASKQVLRFLAATSLHSHEVDSVRDKLLHSNPVLEAFGNAKTNRNDNSSRFGKYMDVQYNFKGNPMGGHILNYLLEKSRVVHQEKGERNFHIFYQLIAGGSDLLLKKLHLVHNPNRYHYLNQGNSCNVASINDKDDFNTVLKGLKYLEFSDVEEESILSIVAAILHLGNVNFGENEEGKAVINEEEHVKICAELLGCDATTLINALTHRTIEAFNDVVTSPLSPEQAVGARDALAKAIYERLFDWLVNRLNKSLANQELKKSNLMGILDIYGFEIFEKNGFEQLCINYCNEKLQQLFIELTLRSEQDEYRREGIEWEEVEYFDNKIICDLIEEKHKGIISLMDEECLRPGDATDMTFLNKLNDNLNGHHHYFSYETAIESKVKKTINRDEFRLRHYAGNVAYSVKGFLEKNNDLLFRDLKETMSKSNNKTIEKIFPRIEVTSKKRPETAATQFKNSLTQLMEILMVKQPSYIRCIKPNEHKSPRMFDRELVSHQVKYLGLMENLRVRRAGFCYRRTYDMFLSRYKGLCPATWPNYKGDAKDGVRLIVNQLEYHPDEYRFGETKLFIKMPKTLFKTEDAYQLKKEDLATMIQAKWKAFMYRRRFLKMKQAVTMIAKHWRKIAAKKILVKRKWAASVVRGFILGFITRNEEVNENNARFQQLVKCEWLNRLAKALPQNVLDKSWPMVPYSCTEASVEIKKLYTSHLAGRYVKSLSPERKFLFEEKVLAEQLFKDKKVSYMKSLPSWFVTSRFSTVEENLRKNEFEDRLKTSGEKTKYCTPCKKFDRHGYKQRDRLLILTSAALYLVEAVKDHKLKLKHRFNLKEIQGLVLTSYDDDFLLVRIPSENLKKDKDDSHREENAKGDLILEVPNPIEVVTKIVSISDNSEVVTITNQNSVEHNFSDGKHKSILIGTGNVSSIIKNKEGQLTVVGCL